MGKISKNYKKTEAANHTLKAPKGLFSMVNLGRSLCVRPVYI